MATDARCETCNWWKHETTPDPKWGNCAKASDPMGELVTVEMSGQEGGAWLETHRAFGCVLWEPIS